MKTLDYLHLDEKKVQGVVSALHSLLADFQVFYTNLRGFHWDIEGHGFFVLHGKFEELYDDAAEKADQIAERILMLGVPAGLQNAIFAIANLFIQAGVNSFDSLMVKGNSAAANADAMIYDAMAAFYMACASFMSQNYGAGKLDRVKKSYFIALAYSFGLGAVLGGGLLVFGRQFLALFTTESAVIDAGMKRIMVMGWAYCTSAFMDCTIAASRGLGKTVGPTVIVILGSCVFRVAWVYTIFAHFHTIPALYLLYPCSWALTAAAEIVYFVFSYRRAALRLQERDALAQM